MSTLEDWKSLSEIIKNGAEILVILGGLFALWKWLAERKDRSTDILLKLEQEFQKAELVKGRLYIEDDVRYSQIKSQLMELTSEARIDRQKLSGLVLGETVGSGPEAETSADFGTLDSLLRFYVVLNGVSKAEQVPDEVLSTCFRYWLCHYYNPKRTEFRSYVDTYFPTLKKWLLEDAARERKSRFFRPWDFGWDGQ